jgi:16S rRNA processing protein RimM
MSQPGFFRLGYIQKLHGFKGGLQAMLEVEEPQAYQKLESVFLLQNGIPVPFFISSISIQPEGKTVLVLEDIRDEKAATALRGLELFIPEAQIAAEDRDAEAPDLEGYSVVDEVHGPIGVVRAVVEYPGQDILEIVFEGKEVLVPFIEDIVLEIDDENKRLNTCLPDGLLEIYTGEDQNLEPDDAD